ncbi:MAG: CHAT domain-containing protein [Chloroflexota bacterium]|nr:CHAT domain-containing protein [Chloroflexota bacterium]
MEEIGTELFRVVFHANEDTRDIWSEVRSNLSDTKIEIVTNVHEATSVPWELIRDPKIQTPLALRAHSFVRTHPNALQPPELHRSTGIVRMLLVISRPSGERDVPFRSVAGRLIRSLSNDASQLVQLDVLRPPSFDELARVLRKAKSSGEPYHVLHFDGHGVFTSAQDAFIEFSPLVFVDHRQGEHGYLLFEDESVEDNVELVDGPRLSSLLVETGVPVLILNACRSAHAEGHSHHVEAQSEQVVDPHQQVRAFGSFAQEVMDAGVSGVIAMRYNVYVVTAAQYVADLYSGLGQGLTLGEAATIARKQLHTQPKRDVGFEPRILQDWCVPVVYESAPIVLFPKKGRPNRLLINAQVPSPIRDRQTTDPQLPPAPDLGFFGRDEVLLRLDRTFDRHYIALIHGLAGSGKTSTAVEFAKWYLLTGGIEGPILFTSFEQNQPLSRVLDALERVFGKWLEQQGIHWLATEDHKRRTIALQVLSEIPVLWIWDNVEEIAGFPEGAQSSWTSTEQEELLEFLRDASTTKAKFILTSRREEDTWLGVLPVRISMPAMPMHERIQLTHALARRHGRPLFDLENWKPLLEYTQGNPLTLTVTVGQALRDKISTKKAIEEYVANLRAGEDVFRDQTSVGRAKSLTSSLNYGFEHSFTERERRQIALLHLFRGFVSTEAFRQTGNPYLSFSVEVMRDFEKWDSVIPLLRRLSDIGLLTPVLKGMIFSIHPALSWFLKELFDRYYPPGDDIHRAYRAFTHSVAIAGSTLHDFYGAGNREAIIMLTYEEENLLHAFDLAKRNDWWEELIGVMQGFRTLYGQTGRRSQWRRLVDEVVPLFVDTTSGHPLPGREDTWGLVTDYRVKFAREEHQLALAEQLHRPIVDWQRQRSAAALAKSGILNEEDTNTVASLAVALETLGSIRKEQGEADCLGYYEESVQLFKRIGRPTHDAIVSINLGTAYLLLPQIRDLDKAEEWFNRSMDLMQKDDALGRADVLRNLGDVAEARALQTLKASTTAQDHQVGSELLRDFVRLLNEAIQYYYQSLAVLPNYATDRLVVTHAKLGQLINQGRTFDKTISHEASISHYRQAIRLAESVGDFHRAAQCRLSIAVTLAYLPKPDYLQDALLYANTALQYFESTGSSAAGEARNARELIEHIEKRTKQAQA